MTAGFGHGTRRAVLVLAALGLTACLAPADLPERRGTAQGPTPELLPIRDILAQHADGPNTARLSETSTEARAAALRARAARLRGPVIAAQDRDRMNGSAAALD
ncbi:MAG: hypothetical protein JJT99_08275 [Rhodobacteraceae bacterium]|nr:hypothetical protein [Paracoccaceae bacterium]